MTEREKLIEAACEAMHDAYEAAAVREGWETQERSRKPWADVPDANKRTMRAAVAAALAVFEKALGEATVTPTDDEREALARKLEDEVSYRVRTAVALYKGGHDYEEQVRQGRPSVRFLAAGFRRTEVPERTQEDRRDAARALRDAGNTYVAAPLGAAMRQHMGIDDPSTNPLQGGCAGFGGGASVGVPEPSACLSCLGACRGGRHCCENCENAEPQGEPSDAQVRAAWDSLGESVTVHFDFEDLRAALRAAGRVQ